MKVNIEVRQDIKLIQAIADWISCEIFFEENFLTNTFINYAFLVHASTTILKSAKIQGVENAWKYLFIFSGVGYLGFTILLVLS